MATLTGTTTFTSSGVSVAARGQEFAGYFETILTNGGWVRTADTGQTLAASMSGFTSTANTSSYNQIWRMADSLQATAPVYIKIEFGTGNATYCPGLWITIGTGSDGSGNITGTKLSRTQIASSGVDTTSNIVSYLSASTSRLSAVLYQATGGTSLSAFGINIERSKDSSGADSSDGIILNTAYCYSDSHAYVPFSGTARAAQTQPCPAVGYNLTSLASGNTIGLIPLLPFALDGCKNPGLGFLAYMRYDTAPFNSVTVTVNSTSITYIMLGIPGTKASFISGMTTYGAIAMRYE